MSDQEHKDLALFAGIASSVYADPEGYGAFVDSSSLELEPVAGNRVLGALTDEEIRKYLNVLGIEAEKVGLLENIQSNVSTSVAKSILDNEGHLSDELIRTINSGEMGAEFMEEYFFLDNLYTHKVSEFWFIVRLRLQTFATRLSIRAGYKVVVTGSKISA